MLTELPYQYGAYMTCPTTGLQIPKTLHGNLAKRRDLRISANKDLKLRSVIRAACASSCLFWLNMFGWTYHAKKVGEDGVERKVIGKSSHVPFITWKVQDEAILKLIQCIGEPGVEDSGGEDVLINKSRDMGASWIAIAVFHWYWQFQPNSEFLEMSRSEKYVDERGNMDSLFEKHRYLHKMQPLWLQPNIQDTLCKIRNMDNGSLLIGETTNPNAGQGARKTAVLLDEFARVDIAEEIDLALTDTVSCKVYNSTPQGPQTWFSKLYKSKSCHILEMPWFRHPLKGRHAKLADAHGSEIGYKCLPGKKWTSPWYDVQAKKRSKRDLAMNVDMNHGQAGRMFFDAEDIEKHRRLFEEEPRAYGNLVFKQLNLRDDQRFKLLRFRKHEALMFTRGGENPWRFWCSLIDGRPDQTRAYCIGVDISAGTGSSNSIITVYDADTKRIVAKFWSATISPYDLAEEAIKAGIWFGGRMGAAILNWEVNGGVGAQFTTQVKKIGYRPQYVRRNEKKRSRPKLNLRGWWSDDTQKANLLGKYQRALKTLECINPCREGLDECLGYSYDDIGRLTPGSSGVDEDSGATKTHGDHCIADACAYLASEDVTKSTSAPVVVPADSFEGMKREQLQRRREDEAWGS